MCYISNYYRIASNILKSPSWQLAASISDKAIAQPRHSQCLPEADWQLGWAKMSLDVQ